jgi:hypothetical protein
VVAPPTDQIFCPKCGRPGSVAAECGGCRIVIRRFLERVAREGNAGRRVICVRCGELRGDGRRCAQCGSPLLAPYNRAAVEVGLPVAEVEVSEWPDEARITGPARTAGSRLSRVALLFVLGVGVASVLYLAAIRNSAAFVEAESFVLNHPGVLKLLGPDLKQDVFPRGAVQATGSGDRAWFVLDLKGSKGRGVARLQLNRPGGLWQVSSGDLSVRGVEARVDLVPAPTLVPGRQRTGNPQEEIVEQLRAAVRGDPADFELTRQLDYALTAQGLFEEVVLVWNGYLLHREDDPAGWVARGNARLRQGHQPEGRQDLRRACELGLEPACARLE